MSVVLRFVEDGKILEMFVGYYPVHDMTGAALAATMLEVLGKMGMDCSRLAACGFDGAANMSGHHKCEYWEAYRWCLVGGCGWVLRGLAILCTYLTAMYLQGAAACIAAVHSLCLSRTQSRHHQCITNHHAPYG